MKRTRYSKKWYHDTVVDAIFAAPNKSIGVMLGRICVDKDYSVTDVAEYLGVTKMTVYSWFYGYRIPRDANLTRVRELIRKLRSLPDEESNDHADPNQFPAERVAP